MKHIVMLISTFALGMVSFAQTANTKVAVRTTTIPVTDLHFAETGVADLGHVQIAPVYGDPAKQQHGTFVRWPAGFSSSPHVHQADYFAVVVSGVVANYAPADKPVPLAPGSYWSQHAGETHITKCLSQTECVFFIYQPAPFDHVVAAK